MSYVQLASECAWLLELLERLPPKPNWLTHEERDRLEELERELWEIRVAVLP
jgi:hypothetical protein